MQRVPAHTSAGWRMHKYITLVKIDQSNHQFKCPISLAADTTNLHSAG